MLLVQCIRFLKNMGETNYNPYPSGITWLLLSVNNAFEKKESETEHD